MCIRDRCPELLVVRHHEQFGALAAALVAERLGLPGTSPESILAAQHKLHARQVLQQVAPEANLGFEPLQAVYGGPVPEGLRYPCFVKPVKAAFSVLARQVNSRAELHAHTRFGRRELWVIRRLVEPFERVMQARLPGGGTAHRMMPVSYTHLDVYKRQVLGTHARACHSPCTGRSCSRCPSGTGPRRGCGT